MTPSDISRCAAQGMSHTTMRRCHMVLRDTGRSQLSGFKNDREWKKAYPNIIPIATACGVMGFFL